MPIKVLHVRSGPACTILALAHPLPDSKPDPCPTLAFILEEQKANEKELLKLAALLTRTADFGPPMDETKFRKLSGGDDIYEFKTSGGLRLLCFKDGTQLIICTHGITKSPKKRFQGEMQAAENARRDYFAAKVSKTLLYGPLPRKKLK